MEQVMGAVLSDAPNLFAILLVFALAPAVFEELAFRGFILSGLQSLGSGFKAIIISSLLFGLAHSILQQSIITFFLGCLLGFIAMRTASLIPCILYHVIHNSISTLFSLVTAETLVRYPLLQYLLVEAESGGHQYNTVTALILVGCGVLLICWFWNLPQKKEMAPQGHQHKSDLQLGFEAFVSKLSAK
jgi:sodium transport system permease protein